jgi:hypothetical protein
MCIQWMPYHYKIFSNIQSQYCKYILATFTSMVGKDNRNVTASAFEILKYLMIYIAKF